MISLRCSTANTSRIYERRYLYSSRFVIYDSMALFFVSPIGNRKSKFGNSHSLPLPTKLLPRNQPKRGGVTQEHGDRRECGLQAQAAPRHRVERIDGPSGGRN